MSARRTERLINLVIALTDAGRPMTRAELRELIADYSATKNTATFERMFERDKKALADVGFTLTVVTDDVFGSTTYELDRGELSVPSRSFTPAEVAAVGIAARVWEGSDVEGIARTAFTKVKAYAAASTNHAEQSGVVGGLPGAPFGLRVLFDAVSEQREVTFTYMGTSGDAVSRRLQPWLVTCQHGRWYVTGFDLGRKAPRTFLLRRMVSAPRLAGPTESFTIPDDAREHVFSDADSSARGVVQLRIEPGRAWPLRHKLGVSPRAESVTCQEADFIALLPDIVEHDGVTVVAPPFFVRDVSGARERLLKRHAGVAEIPSDVSTDFEAVCRGNCYSSESVDEEQPPSDGKTSSLDRMARILALVPFVTSHPGVDMSELMDHFGVTRKQLIADLELLFVCGTPGYFPDDLIDVSWDDDEVFLRNADHLSSPPPLTKAESLVLVAGLEAVSGGVAGDATYSAKAVLLGEDSHTAGESPADTSDVISPDALKALHVGGVARMTYYSASRDIVDDRVVSPWLFRILDGAWYMEAYCHTAGGRRLFKLARILDAAPEHGVVAQPPPSGHGNDSDDGWDFLRGGDVALLALRGDARSVIELPGVRVMRSKAPGVVYVAVKYRSKSWLLRIIRRMVGDAEICHPQTLRDSLTASINAAYPLDQ